MSKKRFLSLWFPRLAAERLARLDRALPPGPVAVVATQGNSQYLSAVNARAGAAGLVPGQRLSDARALCPDIMTRPADPKGEAAFLSALRRWAGRFTPWVAEEPPDALVLDITGCAHLFGGEEGLAAQIMKDCAALGLSLRWGLADTPGAAWALARFSPDHPIAPAGATRAALVGLPVAALRIEPGTVEILQRLGLRRIGDILGMPRAVLARRFGPELVRRFDQALGVEPEPVSPARPELRFALRLGLPEPIGREEDLLAALDRLLPELAERLNRAGRGARRLRVEFGRTDHSRQAIELGLARPTVEPDRIRSLIAMKLGTVDPGFGIDLVRLLVPAHEPLAPVQENRGLGPAGQGLRDPGLADLMGRIGARLGLEALQRLDPAESHIPEKAAIVVAAAFAPPGPDWRRGPERPLRLWPPEALGLTEGAELPLRFRWRGREHRLFAAEGPERIAPEWWLDEPAWRTGSRDYWRAITDRGEKLWLFYAHGAALSAGWFCHGAFA